MHSTVPAFLQDDMIDRRHCAFVFLDTDDVTFVSDTDWPRRLEKHLSRSMNFRHQSSQSGSSSSKAWTAAWRLDTSQRLKWSGSIGHRVYSVVEGLANAWAFPSMLFQEPRLAFVTWRKVERLVYVHVRVRLIAGPVQCVLVMFGNFVAHFRCWERTFHALT